MFLNNLVESEQNRGRVSLNCWQTIVCWVVWLDERSSSLIWKGKDVAKYDLSYTLLSSRSYALGWLQWSAHIQALCRVIFHPVTNCYGWACMRLLSASLPPIIYSRLEIGTNLLHSASTNLNPLIDVCLGERNQCLDYKLTVMKKITDDFDLHRIQHTR
jgi:hypothetical protein